MWKNILDVAALNHWRKIEEDLIVQDLGCAISATFARSQGWTMTPIEGELSYARTDPELSRIVAAFRAAGTNELVFDYLEASWECVDNGVLPYIDDITKLGQIEASTEDLAMVAARTWGKRLLISPDCRVALLVTREEHSIIAGPESFVTAAIGKSIREQRATWRQFAASWADERQRSYYNRVADYYERA